MTERFRFPRRKEACQGVPHSLKLLVQPGGIGAVGAGVALEFMPERGSSYVVAGLECRLCVGLPISRVNPGGTITSSGVSSVVLARPSASNADSIPARRTSSTFATPG